MFLLIVVNFYSYVQFDPLAGLCLAETLRVRLNLMFLHIVVIYYIYVQLIHSQAHFSQNHRSSFGKRMSLECRRKHLVHVAAATS